MMETVICGMTIKDVMKVVAREKDTLAQLDALREELAEAKEAQEARAAHDLKTIQALRADRDGLQELVGEKAHVITELRERAAQIIQERRVAVSTVKDQARAIDELRAEVQALKERPAVMVANPETDVTARRAELEVLEHLVAEKWRLEEGVRTLRQNAEERAREAEALRAELEALRAELEALRANRASLNAADLGLAELKTLEELVVQKENQLGQALLKGDVGEVEYREIAALRAEVEALRVERNTKRKAHLTRVATSQDMATVVSALLEEYHRAVAKHPQWPTDPRDALMIIAEEAGGAIKAYNDLMHGEQGMTPIDRVAEEVAHTGATVLRFLLHWNDYAFMAPGWTPEC